MDSGVELVANSHEKLLSDSIVSLLECFSAGVWWSFDRNYKHICGPLRESLCGILCELLSLLQKAISLRCVRGCQYIAIALLFIAVNVTVPQPKISS